MTTTPNTGAAELPEAQRFTKKPVTIEAIKWTGKNLRQVITFTDGPPDTRSGHVGMDWEAYADLVARDGLKIYTLEGKMLANVGDWIIRGVKGEYYPCKPDIFDATYSPAAHVSALSAAQAGVPAGYALVPVDATDAMMAAFAKGAAVDVDWDVASEVERQEVRDGFGPAYRAMLAAAPQPIPSTAPAQPGQEGELLQLANAYKEYIDALPADVVAALPAMPGVDGDWASEVLDRAAPAAAQPDLGTLTGLAKQYADSYASPHHFTLGVNSLRQIIQRCSPQAADTPTQQPTPAPAQPVQEGEIPESVIDAVAAAEIGKSMQGGQHVE